MGFRALCIRVCCGLLLMTSAVSAQELIVQNEGGVSQAWIGNFGVSALITIDPDWMEKWNTPPEVIPEFKGTDVLTFGQRAYLLTFFSGASAPNGKLHLTCDLTLTSVSGEVKEYPPQTCARADNATIMPGQIYMTLMDISFAPDETYSNGTLGFTIGITDENTGVRVPVSISVEIDVEGD